MDILEDGDERLVSLITLSKKTRANTGEEEAGRYDFKSGQPE